jgi:hypothetical protein
LVLLIGATSFVPESDRGRLVLNGARILLLIATVAAVGRTLLSFVVALCLAVPAVGFQFLNLRRDSDHDWHFRGCSAPRSTSSPPPTCSGTFSSRGS